MASRIGEVIVDCSDPVSAATSWCSVLGFRITDQDEIGVAVAGHSTAPTIDFLVSNDTKLHKNRLHLDVCPIDVSQEEEVRRLVQLGRSRVDIGQLDVLWVVMEVPVGNEFCVMNTIVPPGPEPFHHMDGHA